jgi:hypothetical protein
LTDQGPQEQATARASTRGRRLAGFRRKRERGEKPARARGFFLALVVLLANTITTGVVGYILNEQLKNVEASIRDVPPSCNNPLDLRLLTGDDYTAAGHWFYEEDPYIASLSPKAMKDFQNLRPERAIDGSTNTLWVPPAASVRGGTFVPAAGPQATLTLTFATEHDVALVCVVNGYASEAAPIGTGERVRTLAASTDRGSRNTVLPSQPDCCFQNSQELRIASGATDEVKLTVLNAYSGQIVFTQDGDYCDRATETDSDRDIDPDDPRDPDDAWELAVFPGCYVGAEAKAGIAEVLIYVES